MRALLDGAELVPEPIGVSVDPRKPQRNLMAC